MNISRGLGVFEMMDKGLIEVKNASELILAGRPMGVSGSVVTCSMEGTRPMLIEAQALSFTTFGTARRTATGIDYNWFVILMAVLEMLPLILIRLYLEKLD